MRLLEVRPSEIRAGDLVGHVGGELRRAVRVENTAGPAPQWTTIVYWNHRGDGQWFSEDVPVHVVRKEAR